MKDWASVWQRLREGHPAVVHRNGPFAGPNPRELRFVEVDCEAFVGEPRGVLEEARRRVELMLEESPHRLVEAATGRLRAGLRRHLLGETGESADIARYLSTFERAGQAGEPRVALLLRGVDRSDPASLELLTRLVAGEQALRLPILFAFDAGEPAGPARELLERLRRALPSEAFWWERARERPSEAAGARLPASLSGLSALSLGVLRAAAVIGDRFEAEVVAKLLQVDELEVLVALQEADDQGITLEDRGQGVFRLERSLGETLRARTLPSLARAWHERLAQLFGGPPAPRYSAGAPGELPEVAPPAAAKGAPLDAPAQVSASLGELAPSPPSERAAVASAPAEPSVTEVAERAPRDCFEASPGQRPESEDPRRESWWRRLEADLMAARVDAAGSEPAPAAAVPQGGPNSARGSSPGTSELRAATHAEAAGLWHTACEQHLAVAERAALAGSHQVALEHAAQAWALAEQLGDRERRRRVQMLALLFTGRSRWQCQAPGAGYSLQAALEPLLGCRALVTEADPAQLRAELAALIANVQYDIGTPDALEQALLELTLAGQLLLEAGQPLDAARLLNDEAAVWVKLGDPVRANHLLSRSREVFSKVVGSHPAARSELAETEHLLARLLMTATPRPGRERAALQLGVEHGRAAERAYRELNDRQKLGRVWETVARLEQRLGHLDAAAKLFEDARQLQREMGDAAGLARSCAGASELLAQVRDYGRALERLAESVRSNSEKGLRAGLEFNRASLQQLRSNIPGELQGAAQGVEALLLQALNLHEPLAVA